MSREKDTGKRWKQVDRRPAQCRRDRGTVGTGTEGRGRGVRGQVRGSRETGQGTGRGEHWGHGWGTPVGRDRGQGDREKCSKRCPSTGTEEGGDPGTECLCHAGGTRLAQVPPGSPQFPHPALTPVPQPSPRGRVPPVSPGPCHPLHTPVPVPPFLCALDVSPCPRHPHAPLSVPNHTLSPSPARGSPINTGGP